MADKYSSDLVRIVIAQITQTIGYSSTLSAPLELLQDILLKFMQEFARDLHGQMEHANRLEPNLKDARLTLKSLSINVHELLDYIGNVEPVAFPRDVAAFPIKRASNMNFLKPGSAETLTRPIYIYEYLPPMQPNAEPGEPPSTATNIIQDSELRDISNESERTLTLEQESSSKIDLDPLSMVENRASIPIDSQAQSTLLHFPSNKNCDPDNGRTVREMSSVVMTTGGFISPAIEGKLPDAFVPDIIEKYKGLHAPPVPSPVIAPVESPATKPDTSLSEEIRYLNSTASKLNERDQQHIENRNTAIGQNTKKESKFVMSQENPNPSVPVMLNAKASKKSKKQKHFLSNPSGMERIKAEMNVHGGKAQEKAQRKAMKMFQKLAKSQNEGGNSQLLHLKKSKKRINRGTLPSLAEGSSERIKLEKILKKQAKRRQKQFQGQVLQSELDTKPLDIAPITSDPAHVAVTSKAAAKIHEETALKSNADSRTTVVGAYMENQEEFSLVGPASESVDPQGAQVGLSSTKKHNSEPERNKLDIFKKISKPKTPRLEVPGLSGTLAVAGNLFESTASSPPLINLPSGTTITPAPSLGLSMEYINVASSISAVDHQTLSSYGVMMPTPKAPSPQETVDLMIIDSSKPKKRGRKPGGKNQNKLVHSATDTVAQLEPQSLPPIASMKKGKQSHINAMSVSMPSSALLLNPSLVPIPITTPTEPLNLSNVPQCKVKEKKERKKYKTKYDSFVPENEKEKELVYNGHSIANTSPTKPAVHGSKPSSIVPSAGQYMAVGGGMPHAALYPSNPTGIVPLLPLLHFPPRPGLIPSGPGLFPATAGLVGFGSSVSMPPFMPFPGPSGAVTDSVCRPSAVDTSETDKIGQFLRMPSAQTDSQTERNYCNVAPLVPESMKFSVGGSGAVAGPITGLTVAEAVSKPKTKPSAQATGNLGDPIEVSDDSDESTQNKKQLSPTNLGRSNMLQPQLLPYAITPATSIDDSQLHSKDILHPSISPNSCESIKKLKKQSKFGPPDVKMLTTSATPSCNTPCFPQFNMPNFKGGDKFSLAGGADLIPLSRLECGLAYSSQTVPATSLSAVATSGSGSGLVPTQLNISEEQQFMPSFSSYEDITITPTNTLSMGQGLDELKMRKLHKKLKKPKEGKIKKKKDKKDKTKEKEKNSSNIHKSEKKIKGPDKKQKKEKKKDKQIITHIPADAEDFQNNQHLSKSNERISSCEVFSGVSVMPSIPIQPSPKFSPNALHDNSPQVKLELSPNPVPKLTLKLGGKSTPLPCADRDIDTQDAGIVQNSTMGGYPSKRERERDDSPELARFSPLVTGPPKAKPCETPFSSNTLVPLSNSNTTNSPVKPLTLSLAPMMPQMVTSHPAANSGGWMSNTNNSAVVSSTLSASSVLLPQQLMLASKPIVNNFTSVIGISAETPLGTGLVPVSPNNSPNCPPQIVELNRPSSYVDAEGNRIWICPACGKVDDGSAMIGCDGCDAWYHWTCVGITVAPKDNDDWFCRVCITKKKVHGSEKKKKRNKKKVNVGIQF